MTALWIVAMPLYELLWSTIRRIVRGVSPFKADSDHFHHLLLKAGFGVRGAFFVFVLLGAVLAAFGLAAFRLGLPDHYSFMLLIAAGVGIVCLMYRADLLWKLIPDSLRRLPPLEPPAPRKGGVDQLLDHHRVFELPSVSAGFLLFPRNSANTLDIDD